MKNASDRPDHFAGPEQSTMTDLRLTKMPADTPRGRLHRLAVLGARAADELRQLSQFDNDAKLRLRDIARRGLSRIGKPRTRGERMIAVLCNGLDLSIYSLLTLDLDTVAAMSVGLTMTLVQLEAAENKMHEMAVDLEKAGRDLKSARNDVTQLRALLAKANNDQARKEAEAVEWDEKTRSSPSGRDTKDLKKRTIITAPSSK